MFRFFVDIRLVDGSYPSEGRLEVFRDGAWGTVTDHGFYNVDGRVVCRTLGYAGIWYVWHFSTYGQGTGPILMDDVACTGNENSISDCNYNGPDSSDSHNLDVSMRCQGEVFFSLIHSLAVQTRFKPL